MLTALELADIGGNPRGAAWAPDGTIVFAAPQTAGLTRVPESGGKPVPLTTLDQARGESSHRWPDVLPGGKWVLFHRLDRKNASFDEARIEAVSLATGGSDELDGVFQVYVRSFPDGTHKVRASPSGARSSAWDAQGNLHYWQMMDDTLRAVPTTEKDGQLLVGLPTAIWRGTAESDVVKRIVNPVAGARYDLEPRGTRFLVLESAADGSRPEFSYPMVVLGGPMPPQQ